VTEAPGGTVTILFTDIVASTSLTEQLGDAEFRQRARELDTLLRTAISEGAGRSIEGKLLGDGVLAVFSSAGRAIECAVRCCALAEGHGLPLHIGLHVGDVLQEGDNVFGGAVNIAARICAASAAGEVLVSDTVRSLARTSVAVRFEDRGPHILKGIADPLRLFAVRPKEPGGWIDAEARGLRKLWANRAFRIAAALLALAAIGGGVAGGLVLSGAVGGGSSAANAYRRIDYHAETTSTALLGGGDCVSTDAVF
jgi:class 3 adenylate cyclase